MKQRQLLQLNLTSLQLDPHPDEFQEPLNDQQHLEMLVDDQMANLPDEPPDQLPLLMPLAPESEIPEPVDPEAVDATGLCRSTRI